MNRIPFLPDDKVAIVRSAHIGDFIVCLPLIYHLLTLEKLRPENLYFIIINNSGANPVTMLFGNNFIPAENVRVISNDPRQMVQNVQLLRSTLPKDIYHILYLPFSAEPAKSLVKKAMLLKSVFGLNRTIHGVNWRYKTQERSQYLSLLERFGYPVDTVIDYSAFLHLESENITKKLKSFPPLKAGKHIAVYPHSKLTMKIWPRENYIELIKYLNSKYNIAIYLVGGPEDYNYNQGIADCFAEDNIVNTAGVFSIRESIVFLKRMDLFIGNDGAPMHMAALADIPIMALFTYKEPVGVWDPVIASKLITMRNNVMCLECGKKICTESICISNITTINAIYYIDEIFDDSAVP